MTREEAIKVIKGELKASLIIFGEKNDKETQDAFRMAIEALEENESLARSLNEASELLRKKRPHGEWVSKPKRVQVDETDEERIFETKLEWFCSSCGKSFDFRKPDDAFCKYCGSDNRPRKHGCCFADETCKNNPCKDCGLKECEAE